MWFNGQDNTFWWNTFNFAPYTSVTRKPMVCLIAIKPWQIPTIFLSANFNYAAYISL